MQPPASLSTLHYAQVPFEIWLPMWLDYIGPSNADLSLAVHQFTDQRIREASSSLRGFIVATDQPVGFVHFYFHPSSCKLKDACTIEDLYVAPCSRGRGVGRWLINRVAAIATAKPVSPSLRIARI